MVIREIQLAVMKDIIYIVENLSGAASLLVICKQTEKL